MVSVERIDQYKKWFDNLSFFNNYSFVLDNIEDLWDLTNYLGSKYESFSKYSLKDLSYSPLSNEECFKLVQVFLDKHHHNISVEDLLKNNILIINQDKEKEKDDIDGTIKDGTSYYDDNRDRLIEVTLENSFLDYFVLIHEILHFTNQPEIKRSFESDLLTEAISYGGELIGAEDLKDKEFTSNRTLHYKTISKLLFLKVDKAYPIYKIIYLYKIKGDINESLYKELFDDDFYESTLEEFEQYTVNKKSILRDTWLVLGLPLAIYFLEQYRSDENNYTLIHNLNNCINTSSLNECLSVINMNDLEEFKNKIIESTDSFIQILNELYMDNQRKI